MDGWYEFVVTSFYQLCLLKIGYDKNGFLTEYTVNSIT